MLAAELAEVDAAASMAGPVPAQGRASVSSGRNWPSRDSSFQAYFASFRVAEDTLWLVSFVVKIIAEHSFSSLLVVHSAGAAGRTDRPQEKPGVSCSWTASL